MKKFEEIKKEVFLNQEISANDRGCDRYRVFNNKCNRVLIKDISFLFTCDKDEKLTCLKDVSVVAEGGVIKEIRRGIKEENFDIVYDAGKRGGTIVTPGFINTHSHPAMYLLRSSMDLDEGENIDETLSNLPTWEKQMTEEDFALSIIGELTEQQKFGVTTTMSHYNFFDPAEVAAKFTGQNLVNGISAASHVSAENTPELIERLIKEKNDSVSRLAICVHYLHKASPETLEKISELSRKHNLLFTCHMAESEKVLKDSYKKYGMSETEILKKYNLLNSRTLVSHAIHVPDREIEELVKAGVGIAHLPTSNRIHKSGVFPFWKFSEKGGFQNIALGTDSVISKSRQDILTEAYKARTTHLYLRTIKFGSLFKMATLNGAKVLHMEDRGRVLPGFKADLVFWKLKDRGFVPYNEQNPFSLIGNMITHSGRTVRDLMINGRFIIKKRRHLMIDESNVLRVLQKRHMKMRERVERHSK